jgi:hypothetical protein
MAEPLYHDCHHGRRDDTWQRMHDLPRGDHQSAAGKHRQPSAGINASPSVKTTAYVGATDTIRLSTSTAASDSPSALR